MNEAVLSLAAAGDSIGSTSLLGAPPSILEFFPGATYACDAAGHILWFNRKAADLWGRAPGIGDDTELFCGAYKWLLNGRHIKREETPMAFVLKAGAAVHGVDGTIERPDGSQIAAVAAYRAGQGRCGQAHRRHRLHLRHQPSQARDERPGT